MLSKLGIRSYGLHSALCQVAGIESSSYHRVTRNLTEDTALNTRDYLLELNVMYNSGFSTNIIYDSFLLLLLMVAKETVSSGTWHVLRN